MTVAPQTLVDSAPNEMTYATVDHASRPYLAHASVRHAIQGLGLWNFRHTAHWYLHPQGRSVLLSGANGVGKTNILEAISLLSPGRGVRQAQIEQFLHHDAPPSHGWKIEAALDNGYTLSSTWQEGFSSRQVSIEGEKVSQLALGQYCRCISLGPRDDQIFLQGDEALRRFIDRLIAVFDPAHIGRVQALRQLQKQWRELLEAPHCNHQWLAALEKSLAAKMVVVSAARHQHSVGLQRMLGQLPEFITRSHAAAKSPIKLQNSWMISLGGEVSAQLAQHPARLVETNLADTLATQRHVHTLIKLADRWQFTQQQGTQRRIAVEHLSHGQQKIALLALILAQTWMMQQELGHTPILLLDEGISQLDAYHSAMLLDHLRQLDCQYWLSGVDLSAWAKDDSALLVDLTPTRFVAAQDDAAQDGNVV